MLEFQNITKQFGAFTAVEGLNLSIPENEIFGLLGGNGAGKTTTFRMLLRLIDQTKGTISWKGEGISYDSSHLIGYLPEERGLYPKMKVKEQLIYLGKLRGMKKAEVEKEIAIWLERFKVPEYLDKKVEELSKGNQQKIQFIASVIHKPELLILDEPFSGLDPVNVEVLKEAVVDLKKSGTTILFSSHRMEHVEELCEHLCILHKGKAVVSGNLKEIKRSYGKKNIRIDADFDVAFLENVAGVVRLKQGLNHSVVQIENEQVSQTVLRELVSKGFVRQFELEEPSLNDIFIEKVGAAYE
ncbi:ABC transporter ATP-binding protein [Bacillus sp. N1-1]|jgi:ABC-2 type transport system ATP-binding protein|uniref:ABC transporter ATP-binding protein n=1 Tax=Bacillus sp. N1-1 TaxID=2682541 RepID=UPI0013194573|nr:ABC transporter ATP-binding protein [Bacillus sp. N1-1]QHA90480.1 ATP-binding cassette domain-containing protein [Bacillus sp. N1-1]